MTKADLIHRIATGTGLTRLETEAVVNGLIAILTETLVEGGRVDIRGFGSFRVEERARRTARNPRTNETIEVEGRHVPVFRPSTELREEVNRRLRAKE